MTKSSGFTLIELTIVVAIIGIIAAFSVPIYQGYVVKSQINRVVAELSRYKTAFEEQVSHGGAGSNAELGFIVSDLTNANAGVDIATVNTDGSGQISVTMGGTSHPHAHGLIIRLERTVRGQWSCKLDHSAVSANWQALYRPESCSI